MKKKMSFLGMVALAIGITTGCGNTSGDEANGDTPIAVISREEGSGTRSAFEELMDINTDDDNLMTTDAIIRDGNGVVATEVAQNPAAIGYVSFATVDANEGQIVGKSVGGVAPTAENVLNGTYEVARAFNMVYVEDELSDVARAFIEFIGSTEGLQALESAGVIVDVEGAEGFDRSQHEGLAGSLSLGGSTSTESSVVAVAEVFGAMFPQVTFSYMSQGSGAGVSGAQDGTFDIGFASREVLDSELGDGAETATFAKDGIVFIVHPDNEVTDLTVEQIRDIYLGNITSWSELD